MKARTELPKILVVNDDPASLLGLVGLLSEWAKASSCEILAARSGEDALREVLQHDFAVILLDVNMPGMDGFETARAIHQRQRSSSTPIIFITAYHADEMDRLKGYENGAVDYLFTPIIPQILKAKLSVFVALAMKNIELSTQAKTLEERQRELTAANERLKEEINERRRAEKQNKAKDDFLAMLGHELRNPLGAIASAAAILNAGTPNANQISYATGVIQRQSHHLKRIVDDLLDLSRIISGKIALSKQPFAFSKLVETCIDSLQITGRMAPYQIETRIEPAWMHGDPVRIEQIITNLLDNALRYTPPGGKISIEVVPEGDRLLFKVADSGMGIDADLLPHIFEVFVQGDNSLERTRGGLGIGLALVREMASLHGGKISASSDGVGRGSVFTLQMPLLSEQGADHSSVKNSEAYQCRVLLIDDNDDGRDTMALLLATDGKEVFTAPDGLSGVKIATEKLPDIALIDIGLPGMDGYEVARRLRGAATTQNIKLVALTGYGQKSDKQRALDAGFDVHLVKPVRLEEINEVITACLGAQKKLAA